MKYAPILVTVYNRINHFKRCIESLKKCDLSNQSHLFVAIDAPFREADIEINLQIIEYSQSIEGFEKITLFVREDNLGSRENIDKARNHIFQHYDRLIFTEDDNVFSTSFLVNINKCLEIYKSRKDIFSVSGYNMPFTLPQNYKKDIYIWQGMSAWGVGLWRDKWMSMDFNLNKVDYWLSNKNHLRKINSVAQHYYYALIKMQKNKNLGGDGFVSNYLIENDMYSIFPSQTLVRNIGHDGKGNNSFFSNKFKNQLISNYLFNNLPIDILPDKQINKKLWWYFSNINRLKDRLNSSIIKFFS
mgnify:CR=1 FL=1